MLFPLFGLPFILVGLGLLSSPFWSVRRASRTAYLVTNKRAVIIEGSRRRTVRSIAPDAFGDILRREGKFGRGDIVFGAAPERAETPQDTTINGVSLEQAQKARVIAESMSRFAVLTSASSRRRAGRSSPLAFLDIENPRQVEELLRSMAGTSW